MATDHNFRVKNGLEVGGQEVISSSGVITSAALGGQTLGTTDSPTFANATLTGSLRGPSTFTIDPAAVGDNTGTLVIAGNLQVDGTTTTINSTTMEVDDLNITLASGSANAAAANGAGITVDIANNTNATLLYNGSIDRWDFNKPLNITGTVDCSEVLVGTQNSRFAENNLRFLSAGTAYIDHSTVGQSIDFRASVSSALDTTVLQVNGNGYVYIRGLRISGADGSVNQIWQSTSNAMLGISANGGDINFGQTSGSIMRLKPSGNVGIGTTDPGRALEVSTDGTAQLRLSRVDSTINGNNTIGSIEFWGTDDTSGTIGATIVGHAASTWGGGAYPTDLRFSTMDGSTLSERLRITRLGDISIGSSHDGFSGWKVLNIRQNSTGGMLNFEEDDGTRSFTFANEGVGMRYQAHITGGYHRFETHALGAGTAMMITDAGNVGIGVAAPNNKLEVDGHIGFSKNGTNGNRYLLIEGADATYAGTLNIQAGFGSTAAGGAIKLYAHSHATYPGAAWIGRSAGAAGDIMFGNGGTGPSSTAQIQMVINSSGNVGIGTASPTSKLHLVTAATDSTNNEHGNNFGIVVPDSGHASGYAASGISMHGQAKNSSGDNHTVFIGMTNRAPALNGNHGTNSYITLTTPSSSGYGNGQLDFYVRNSAPYSFPNDPSVPPAYWMNSLFTIKSNGEVAAHNNGGSSYGSYGRGSVIRVDELSHNQSAIHYIEISGNLPGYSPGQYNCLKTNLNDMHFAAGGVYTGYISYNGGFTDVSDEREKENITTITNATAKLKQLRGVYHTWKDTANRGTDITIGLIAQEVEAVVPEVVTTSNPTSLNTPESDIDGLKGVAYGKLVPLLIETIKELEARITTLEG